MKTLYSIIWGQVSDVLWRRIQALNNFRSMNGEADALRLLTALLNWAFNFQSQKYQAQALQEVIRHFSLLIKARQTRVKHIWIDMRMESKLSPTFEDNGLFTQPWWMPTSRQMDLTMPVPLQKNDTLEKMPIECQMAMGFILGSNRVCLKNWLKTMRISIHKESNPFLRH